MRWSYPETMMALLHSRDGEGVSSLSFKRGYCVMTTILHGDEFWTHEIAAGQTSYGWYVGPWDDLPRGVFLVSATPWSLVPGTTDTHRPQTLEVSEPRLHASPTMTDVGVRTRYYVYWDVWNRGNYAVKQWYSNYCLILP